MRRVGRHGVAVMKRVFVTGESQGHAIHVANVDASVRVAFPAYVLGMNANTAETLAQALMDAAARARMVETDAQAKPVVPSE